MKFMAQVGGGKRRKGKSRYETGKKGGEAVKEKRGPGFFEEVGKKDEVTMEDEYGSDFFSEIGKKGGEARDKDEDGMKKDK